MSETDTLETPPPAAPAESVDAASLVAENIIPGPPPPLTASATPAEPSPTSPGQIDARGVTFDPKLHRTNPDGSPKIAASGRFVMLNEGRPKKAPPAASSTPPRAATPRVEPPGPPSFNLPGAGVALPPNLPTGADQYDALAETFLQMGYGPIVLLLSEDMKTSPDEHALLKQALAHWLRVKQMEDFPPGVAFACMAAGIYLPKLQRPTAKQRLILIWVKVRGFFGGFFARRRELRKVEAENVSPGEGIPSPDGEEFI